MAEMPEETRQKISEANKLAWESPAVRKRTSEGLKQAWTPARREAMSRERREFWRKWREEGRRQKPRKRPTDAAAS